MGVWSQDREKIMIVPASENSRLNINPTIVTHTWDDPLILGWSGSSSSKSGLYYLLGVLIPRLVMRIKWERFKCSM